MSALYTAAATATGDGRNGEARTSDGKLEVNLSTPTEMGGSGEGTNPEQLFATGYAACFLSALKMVARMEKAAIADAAVTADVSIYKQDEGGFKLGVALHVEMSGVDEATADKLVQAAHQVCPYSNATRGNIEVELDVTVG
ncbi:organic hydroperoxide resistance protein [Arthrobacter zhangbolii]|mgnify:FL=1|uniref:Organic hydroperoxide resistance protein n=1 Tax=Arthrobacter zhangbolii TaxID=2886936 RepID=A0A9X1SB64_9MICC|nr:MULTISPECIES: organic hydroperoxide resistance protein [Arthrobacter]MCC3272489.1 organic hydroperoxide resistance protein [Arthrobacter zhangbolii]MCC3294028.1 organic hydroperoxide resistance protein [Arthrobacter zhangbolii]MDN3903553.1 organic hydroperoxide resistance protein [Arthrobacter sp. YD2]UON91655.1 organic hydroperoxide resistance protein [Arthrobacter zhangbolii]